MAHERQGFRVWLCLVPKHMLPPLTTLAPPAKVRSSLSLNLRTTESNEQSK